jgi:flagellar hook protein FlgE
MLTSLYTAVSGLSANGVLLSVISDDIANVNTVGFKGSRVYFGDVLSQILTGIAGSSQIGRGVLVSRVSPLFTQGSFETTTSALDLAIDGDGFFIVKSGEAVYYTRAGQFTLDKEGNIVNPDGLILQGFLVDSSGKISGELGDLKIATTQSPAKMTTMVDIAVNLNASEEVLSDPFTLDGNGDSVMDDPANYNSSTTVTVYDSQGGAHEITLYFVKTGDNTWEVHYVYEDPANPGQFIEAGVQSLSFNTDGSLNDDGSSTPISFNFGTAVTSPQDITFNYGTGTGESPPGNGFDGTTQFASDFAVLNLSQDGYGAGSLKNITISQDGVISGVFTNGQTRILGQVALAKFVSPSGLLKIGRNLYAESFDSGQPIVGAPGTSGLGRVLSNTLELSNVDLAEEFVRMISAQRAFQANARTITVTDELTQELVNLRR